MPIPIDCECGRSFRIKDDLAGKKIRCPQCSGVLTVPAADAEEPATAQLASDDPFDNAAPRPRNWNEPPELDAIQPRPAPPPYRPTPSEKPERPIRRASLRLAPRVTNQHGRFGSINAGVAGGLLMMLIAVVWFVGGLAVNIIFFYPPFLLIVGFIALVKGLTSKQ